MHILWLSSAVVIKLWILSVFALTSSVPSVVDPVTKALEYVEAIAHQKDNCSFGPSLDLQYNKERWTDQAEVAVNAANLLTTLSRTGAHFRGRHAEDEDLLYTLVLSNVQNHADVFGSAIAFKTAFYRDYRLFCPYAFRAPDLITAKDLSIGYNYTIEETDWFHIPFTNFINYTFALESTVPSQAISPNSDSVFVMYGNSCGKCNNGNPEGLGSDKTATPSSSHWVSSTSTAMSGISTTQTYPTFNLKGTLTSNASEVTHKPDVAAYSTGTMSANLTGTSTIELITPVDIDMVPGGVDDPTPLDESDIHILDSMKFVDISDGYWTKPYFDCGGGDVWMVTFSVPFFWSDMDTGDPSGLHLFTFAGVTTIDISLDQLDIYQCDSSDTEHSADGEIFDPFVGTHRCKNTTQCIHIPGGGFQRGAYRCECKRGFYFPPDEASHTNDPRSPAFLGNIIEEEHNKKAYGVDNEYDSAFDCLPCQPGCDECDDDSPCVVEPNVVIRWCFVALNTLCLILLVLLGVYTYQHREIRVFKAASPGLLYVVLLGSGLCYCETVVFVATPLGVFSCQGIRWLRYIGFCLAYGALLFKTWRITKVFTVRSAKPVRITDNNLFLRIGILLAIFVLFLSAWTFLSPSRVQQNYNRAGLKYFECSQSAWDYAGQAGELLMLAWGMYLCIKVRKAPSSFNESKFISVSIYNEALISIFGGIFSFVIPGELSGPDTLLIINFCRLHATFTAMVALLFVSKIVLFYQTNTEKRKTDGRRSQIVFTIDNSSITIDFSHENPEVSGELTRLRQELVDIKEITKLVPIDQSIVNRYKLAFSSLSSMKDLSSSTSPSSESCRSRSDIVGHEHAYDATSGTNTPTFLKNRQKVGVNGIANAFLKSLSGAPSLKTLERDDKVCASDQISEHDILDDDDNIRTSSLLKFQSSFDDERSIKESFELHVEESSSSSSKSITNAFQVTPHGTHTSLEILTHPGEDSDNSMLSLEMFANIFVGKIIKDSINFVTQSADSASKSNNS